MNVTSHIPTMQNQGMTSPSQTRTQNPDGQKLPGFMTAFVHQLQPTSQGTEPKQTTQLSPDDLKALTAKISALLQGRKPLPVSTQPLTPDTIATQITDILQQLKDKITKFTPTTGEINKDALLQLKEEIFQLKEELLCFLKDQGVEQPVIEPYLAMLNKFLQQEQPPTQAIEAKTTLPTLPTRNTETHAPAAIQQNTVERTTPPPLPPTAAAVTTPQNPDSSQQQPVTAKVTGLCAHHSILHSMVNKGSFSSDGFGSQTGGQQQGFLNNTTTLEPVSVDTLNTQNFTNYLTKARSQPSPLTQMVNIQLQRGLNAKIETMTLQLIPAELGRLDIKLKFGKDGSIKAHMIVDKPETLALLQKDSYHLEKILQQTGLDADENSLSFDLRQQSRQQSLEGYDDRNNNADEFAEHMNETPAENTLQAQIAIQANGYITQSGVNIMV